MSRYVKVPDRPSLKKGGKKKLKLSDPNDGPFLRNEHETRFSLDEVLKGHMSTDISMLNLDLPDKGPYTPNSVHFKPELGVIFLDYEGEVRFQRMSELHLCPMDHLVYLLLWIDDSMNGRVVDLKIRREFLRRRNLGEDVTDYIDLSVLE